MLYQLLRLGTVMKIFVHYKYKPETCGTNICFCMPIISDNIKENNELTTVILLKRHTDYNSLLNKFCFSFIFKPLTCKNHLRLKDVLDSGKYNKVVKVCKVTRRMKPLVDGNANITCPLTLCPGNSPPSPGLAPCAILIWRSSACARYELVTPKRPLATCLIAERLLCSGSWSRYRSAFSPVTTQFCC